MAGRYIKCTHLITKIEKTKHQCFRGDSWDPISDLGEIQNYNPKVKKSYYNSGKKINAD